MTSRLHEEGAVEIRRSPARPDGLVEVTWRDSRGFSDMLRPWVPAFLMTGLTAAVVTLVLLVAMVLSG
ncbi:MAG TPA: hypothetical protein VE173_16855 [Longimicrobiales bacterium]|nr:hypothetical protein [Longimicrobiales bacterium]